MEKNNKPTTLLIGDNDGIRCEAILGAIETFIKQDYLSEVDKYVAHGNNAIIMIMLALGYTDINEIRSLITLSNESKTAFWATINSLIKMKCNNEVPTLKKFYETKNIQLAFAHKKNPIEYITKDSEEMTITEALDFCLEKHQTHEYVDGGLEINRPLKYVNVEF